MLIHYSGLLWSQAQSENCEILYSCLSYYEQLQHQRVLDNVLAKHDVERTNIMFSVFKKDLPLKVI